MHGLFANAEFRRQWLLALGWREHLLRAGNRIDAQAVYNRLADAVEDAVGWPAIAESHGTAIAVSTPLHCLTVSLARLTDLLIFPRYTSHPGHTPTPIFSGCCRG